MLIRAQTTKCLLKAVHWSPNPNPFRYKYPPTDTLLSSVRPIQSHKRTHSGVVLAASGFEAGVPVLSFIPSEVFFILFYPCGKTEFMTCHLFLLTAQAIRCLGKRFSRLFSGASQNTWWHKWHEKYAIQFVSGYYFAAWTVIVMCWLQADFYFSSCRADCHFRQLGKAKVFISSL